MDNSSGYPSQKRYRLPFKSTMKHRHGYFDRLKSYGHDEPWPHAFLDPTDLSKAGFSHHPNLQSKDLVKCVDCGLALDHWNIGDVPLKEHLRLLLKPTCDYLEEFRTRNRGVLEQYEKELKLEKSRAAGRKGQESEVPKQQNEPRTVDQGQNLLRLANEESDVEEDTPEPSNAVLDLTKTPTGSKRKAQDSTSSKTSSRASSPSRVTSPVRTMIDQRMTGTPLHKRELNGSVAEEVGGVLINYKRLVEISRGRSVVPNHLKAFLEGSLHEYDWPREDAYATMSDDHAGQGSEGSWGHRIKAICRKAAGCEREDLTYANWNSRVYDPLLELVTENPRYKASVGYMNITDARIQPDYLSPVPLSNIQIQDIKVDFAIIIKPELDMRQHIFQTVSCLSEDAQSINQTMHVSLREKPIAVSFGGGTADTHLVIWAAAGLRKLTRLLEQNGIDAEIPAMPLVTFHGHDMYLSIIRQEADHHNLYGKMHIGSTATVLGAFQTVAGLHVLTDWAHTDYKDWLNSVL